MQSDNGQKGSFKTTERNLGSLAKPISLVFSKNKTDFRAGQTEFEFWLGLPPSQADLTSLSPSVICEVGYYYLSLQAFEI